MMLLLFWLFLLLFCLLLLLLLLLFFFVVVVVVVVGLVGLEPLGCAVYTGFVQPPWVADGWRVPDPADPDAPG